MHVKLKYLLEPESSEPNMTPSSRARPGPRPHPGHSDSGYNSYDSDTRQRADQEHREPPKAAEMNAAGSYFPAEVRRGVTQDSRQHLVDIIKAVGQGNTTLGILVSNNTIKGPAKGKGILVGNQYYMSPQDRLPEAKDVRILMNGNDMNDVAQFGDVFSGGNDNTRSVRDGIPSDRQD